MFQGEGRVLEIPFSLREDLDACPADPDFQPWVQEISAHLASVQDVSSRLDAVLQSLQHPLSSP